jgi:hypothetical protein
LEFREVEREVKMRRRGFLGFLLGTAVAPVAYVNLGVAQEDEDYPATIEAQATKIAKLQATNEALRDRLNPEPTPTTDVETVSGDQEPTPITAELQVAYYNIFVAGSDLKVRGEIINTTDQILQVPSVRFQFLDEDGLLLGEDQAPPIADWIGPRGRMPFAEFASLLGGALLPGDWSSINVVAGDPPYYGNETYPFELEVVDGDLEGEAGGEVTGRIRNNGEVAIGPISIDPAYYDQDDVFLGECFGDYIDLELQPGREARFSVFTSGGCGNISDALDGMQGSRLESYRLIVSVSPF